MTSITYIDGVLSTHPRGFGFVTPVKESKITDDIFVPQRYLESAITGDRVRVEVDLEKKDSKGYEGKVHSILERAHSILYGVVADNYKKNAYYVHVPSIGPNEIAIVNSKRKLEIEDRILFEVKSWSKKKQPIKGELNKYLGNIEDPTTDHEAAILEFNLPTDFPQSVIDAALEYGKEIPSKFEKDRKDLVDLPTFTIDPKDAKDFDDAISVFREGSGYLLYVHIADVSYYVKEGGVIDEEAFKRGNSTYLPGKVIPMLPFELSNELCSLKPNVKRLAVTVEMHLDSDAEIVNSKVYRSVICSDHRFSYEDAKEVLDDKVQTPHKPHIILMQEVGLKLRERRKTRGSLDLSMPELRLKMNKQGKPVSYEIVEYDVTHQMIEEFMLKANEEVARKLVDTGKSGVFRIHADPAEEKLSQFFKSLNIMGFHVSKSPSSEELQQIFYEAKEKGLYHQVCISFVRSMKLAVYSEENVGHYGLSLDHYCHFTSPIRRYSDLVVHRSILGEVLKRSTEEVSRHCSERERHSMKAEMSVRSLKQIRLLEHYMSEDPDRVYEATIIGVKPFFVTFQIDSILVEGSLHVSQLSGDFYKYDDNLVSLIGERTGRSFRVGSKINVCLDAVDFVYKESIWVLSKTNSPKKLYKK